MGGQADSLVLNLVGPSTFVVFAVAFLWAWAISDGRNYLLLIAACCLLSSVGGIFRLIVGWPSPVGVHIFISSLFYISATLAGCEGILRRFGHRIGIAADAFILAAFTGLALWFVYVDPSFVARVYIQNLLPGMIFLYTALRLSHLARGPYSERAVFWILLVFAIQFFPRTFITLAMLPDPSIENFGQSAFWPVLQLTNAVLGTALLLAILIAELSEMIDRLRTERDLDQLTGVLNRRGFEDRAGQLFEQAEGRQPALVLLDLDHFKLVNDTCGHAAGDEVLRAVGALMRSSLRQSEVLGRIGGEEFAILIPDGGRDLAQILVARLEHAIAAADFDLPAAAPSIAGSFGVAVRGAGESYLDCFKRADAALYQAKSEGRSRAIFAGSQQPG
ncbi:GGDEF domain-containing protein [Amorphus coralli]|uniref:GGDEF domain-containing protein n=1 Tax=Amorphus coralli TaxID=340680 RepID=UPI00035F0280|nr:GGDEF domain-containing protein [Amorphus coralli]